LHLNRITTKQFLPLIFFFIQYNNNYTMGCDFIWNIVHESDDNGRSTKLVLQRLMWYKFVKDFDIYEDWFVHEETFGYHNIIFRRPPYKYICRSFEFEITQFSTLKKCNSSHEIIWINTHFGTTLLKTKHDWIQCQSSSLLSIRVEFS
jgi:hypothetical protein